MSSIDSVYFVKSNMPDWGSCSVSTSDDVRCVATVYFTENDFSKSVYANFAVLKPDGSTIYLKSDLVRSGAGIFYFVSNTPIPLQNGTYKYISVQIVNLFDIYDVMASWNDPAPVGGQCKSVTVGGGIQGPVIKELVTNLTDNETLVQAAIFATGSVCEKYTYLGKYREGNNTVFKFQFEKTCNVTELGAGAGLAKFISVNWKIIASLLTLLGVVTIVWMWRDAVTKQVEVQGKISDNTTSNINKVLNDSTLTPEQKTGLIEEILKSATYKDQNSLDSLIQNLTILIIIVVVGMIFIEFLKQQRK